MGCDPVTQVANLFFPVNTATLFPEITFVSYLEFVIDQGDKARTRRYVKHKDN